MHSSLSILGVTRPAYLSNSSMGDDADACRPLRSDSIFEDAYWTFPEAHMPGCYAAARCPAWNPQRETELYLLARKAVLRCSVQRFEDLEVALHMTHSHMQLHAGAVLCVGPHGGCL